MPEALLAGMQRAMLDRLRGVADTDAMPVIEGSAGAPADRRLAVYVRGYGDRLRDCLATDFPALRALIGAQVFDLFADGYLAQRPSRSRSLYDLGAGFADYLTASVPADDADPIDLLPGQLAALERARTEAYRARGPEDEPTAIERDCLPFAVPRRLKVPDTVRLVRADFDLVAILDAANRGDRGIVPVEQAAFYAVARVHYRVAVHDLSATRFAFVERILRGEDVAVALGDASAAERGDLLAWLPQATALGIVMLMTDAARMGRSAGQVGSTTPIPIIHSAVMLGRKK